MPDSMIVFLCDQLRADFLPAYGCRAFSTPNLDRLAARGVVFDRAITQSTVCAPARASMMTGRYVSDHQVWTNDVPFRPGMETIAQRLNRLGYATGAFGKLHHFPADDPKGFRFARQMEEGRLGEREPYLQWLRQRRPEARRVFNFENRRFLYTEEEYYEHWIASEAIGFIERQAEARQPFLAWISFQGPHTPLDPPAATARACDASLLPPVVRRSAVDEARDPSVVRHRRALVPPMSGETILANRVAYAEMIVEIDRQIGRVIDRLESLGLFDSTLIVFSADHGDLLGDFGLNAKGPFPYQAQMGIPMIVANHPALKPGSRSQALAGNIDIAGTLLDAAGDERPLGQSRSLIDLAQAEPRHPRAVNFCEFCDSVKTAEDERFRLCYYPFEGATELFDLQADPKQLVNLSGQPHYAAEEARLLARLVDLAALAKGVRVEAHDFTFEQQNALRALHPGYREDFPVAYPLNARERQSLLKAGLDANYNEFCKTKPIQAKYRTPYWEEPPEAQ
ncbi:MAG: Arylsulfatase [candidate division BRC1 bacterium ADurb.BinA364]|nr:MAG: Arylsulfatase [candidate division BRC1 bacterium ADurb.BinA364]